MCSFRLPDQTEKQGHDPGDPSDAAYQTEVDVGDDDQVDERSTLLMASPTKQSPLQNNSL
jgi:hypothetical protein